MAVWGRREQSDLFEVPYRAAASVLTDLGLTFETPPSDGGPYSLSDRDATTALLASAGWTDVGWEPHDVSLPVGGGVSPEEAGAVALDFGPARLITPEAPSVRRQVVDAITDAYRDHVNADGQVVLGGHVVVVSARRA